jgi:transcriptional regulator with XRE-family HTH domain
MKAKMRKGTDAHQWTQARRLGSEREKTGSQLGQTVRRLRRAAGLSVRMLGRRTGFSASFMSQVERGLASPSIASLERIAASLGVGLTELFREMEPVSPAIVKARDRQVMDSAWSRATLEALGVIGGHRQVEVFLITLQPGGSSGKHGHQSVADLLCILLAGEAMLVLDGVEHHLRQGDCARIPPKTLHRWNNPTKKPVRFIKISCPVSL